MWHKHQLFICRGLSLIECSSPHTLCQQEWLIAMGCSFWSRAQCVDPRCECSWSMAISSRIYTFREDTPQTEVSTLLRKAESSLKLHGLSRIKPRRWLSLANQWEMMKLLSDQYLEGKESVEMEEFNPVACLKCKLEVNVVYINKCGEKYES